MYGHGQTAPVPPQYGGVPSKCEGTPSKFEGVPLHGDDSQGWVGGRSREHASYAARSTRRSDSLSAHQRDIGSLKTWPGIAVPSAIGTKNQLAGVPSSPT